MYDKEYIDDLYSQIEHLKKRLADIFFQTHERDGLTYDESRYTQDDLENMVHDWLFDEGYLDMDDNTIKPHQLLGAPHYDEDLCYWAQDILLDNDGTSYSLVAWECGDLELRD